MYMVLFKKEKEYVYFKIEKEKKKNNKFVKDI